MLRRGDGPVEPGAEAALATATGSGGVQLPEGLRGRFEDSLGTDLGGVRLHTGSDSAAAAAAHGARAFAVDQDIHFGAGEYAPDSAAGRHLLAHEVAHTVQRLGGVRQRSISQPGDAHEVEADRAADAMVAGQRTALGGAPALINRTAASQSQALHERLEQARGAELDLLIHALRAVLEADGPEDRTDVVVDAGDRRYTLPESDARDLLRRAEARLQTGGGRAGRPRRRERRIYGENFAFSPNITEQLNSAQGAVNWIVVEQAGFDGNVAAEVFWVESRARPEARGGAASSEPEAPVPADAEAPAATGASEPREDGGSETQDHEEIGRVLREQLGHGVVISDRLDASASRLRLGAQLDWSALGGGHASFDIARVQRDGATLSFHLLELDLEQAIPRQQLVIPVSEHVEARCTLTGAFRLRAHFNRDAILNKAREALRAAAESFIAESILEFAIWLGGTLLGRAAARELAGEAEPAREESATGTPPAAPVAPAVRPGAPAAPVPPTPQTGALRLAPLAAMASPALAVYLAGRTAVEALAPAQRRARAERLVSDAATEVVGWARSYVATMMGTPSHGAGAAAAERDITAAMAELHCDRAEIMRRAMSQRTQIEAQTFQSALAGTRPELERALTELGQAALLVDFDRSVRNQRGE